MQFLSVNTLAESLDQKTDVFSEAAPSSSRNHLPREFPGPSPLPLHPRFYFGKMAMKIQTLILIALLDRPEDIFADESQVDFWYLTEKLFQEPNPVLLDNERESLNAMISAIQNARGGKAKQHVIESGKHPAGSAALLKWHAAYRFNQKLYLRVQQALEDEGLSPHALIWSRKDKLDDFPPRSDADGALDTIACTLFGENCLARARAVGEFKEAVIAMVHHEWERQRRRYKRAVKTLSSKKLAAQSAFAGEFSFHLPAGS